MIKRIPDEIHVQTGEWRGTTFDIIPKETFAMVCRKINELVDAVNELQESQNTYWTDIAEIKKELQTRAENVQPVAESRSGNVQKIDIGELAYLEKENTELKDELERTRKALELAIERLGQIGHESFQGDQQSINMGFHIRAAAALTDIEQITALEQKDVK